MRCASVKYITTQRLGFAMQSMFLGRTTALVLALSTITSVHAAGGSWGGAQPAAVSDCPVLNAQLVSSSSQPANSSNLGRSGTFTVGDRITVTATLPAGTTAAAFRIVGDPNGVVTLAGPANAPATLVYNVTGPLPAGSVGIGVFIDAVTGQSVTIQGSCVNIPSIIPAWSFLGAATTGGAVALIGLMAAFRRSRRISSRA